ncbi:apical endosomal glycoprotein precursor, putative, partial [Ixodes scapularis]
PYMFIRNPWAVEASGHLVSKKVEASGPNGRCFSFWYNMRHPNSGTLNLYLRTADNSSDLIWTRSGPQGRAWLRGYADTFSDTLGNAVFTGSTSGNSHAAVAVDDVVIDPYGCPAGSCQFEEDFCNWRNFGTNSNTMRWYRNSGPTMSAGGPSVDHTLKTEKGKSFNAWEPIT